MEVQEENMEARKKMSYLYL